MSKEQVITVTADVLKIRNSKRKYLEIPEGHFEEIEHGDTAIKLYRKENEKSIFIVYEFEKKKINEEDK